MMYVISTFKHINCQIRQYSIYSSYWTSVCSYVVIFSGMLVGYYRTCNNCNPQKVQGQPITYEKIAVELNEGSVHICNVYTVKNTAEYQISKSSVI